MNSTTGTQPAENDPASASAGAPNIDIVGDLKRDLDLAKERLDEAPSELPSYRVNDPKLVSSTISKESRRALPLLSDAVRQCQSKEEIIGTVVNGLSTYLGHSQSQTFAESIFDAVRADFLRSDDFRLAVEEIWDQKFAAAGASSALPSERPAKKPRKKSDSELIDVVHYMVNKLVHRNWRSKLAGSSRSVTSDEPLWPKPTESGKDNVIIGVGAQSFSKLVWRPNWMDVDDIRSKNFLDEAALEVKTLLADREDSGIQSALSVYFTSVRKQFYGQKDQPGYAAKKRFDAMRTANQRTTTVHTSLVAYFAKSPLNSCLEKSVLNAAFINNPFLMRLSSKRDMAEMLSEVDIAEDAEIWEIWRDVWEGDVTSGDCWLAEDPFWMSDLLKTAFWVIYVTMSQRGGGKFNKTPVFHLPASRHPEPDLEFLPEIRNRKPGTNGEPIPPAGEKTLWICPAMVSPTVLQNPDCADWVATLYPDPPSADSGSALPLAEYLNRSVPMQVRSVVEKHLASPPDLSDKELQALSGVRGSGEIGAYKRKIHDYTRSSAS